MPGSPNFNQKFKLTMKNYCEKWGRFFVKMMKRTHKLGLTPAQRGRYMSDVVKAYMMGIECGYMTRVKKGGEK